MIGFVSQDEGFGRLTAKLEAALSTTAFQDDTVVKQFSACSQRRRIAKERRMDAAKARRGEAGATTTDAT
jgi:hypothetical protein